MKVNNHTNLDLTELEQQVDRFYPYSKQQLGFDQDPQSINFVSDPENATDMLGKTAFYDPESFSITIYADNRHPKDMMRSLSHELVHHAQNCRGEFDNEMDLGEGYAQEDEHMRNMEKEAYSLGNIVFRDWEDGMKKEINEGYRGEDAVDNRSLRYKTAGVKKQQSPVNRGAPNPNVPKGIDKKNQAAKVINQFGNDLTPEELDLLKIYQEREEITGELDKDSKNEIMRIVVSVLKRKRRMEEMIATPDTVKDAIEDEDSEEDENLTLREAKIMSKRNKLEEMVLEYCQTKNFKTLSEVKQVRKVVEKILNENKDKADIDDDGKISGWEKARSDAIQKNMKKDDKEQTDEGMMDKIKSKFKKKPDTRTDREKNADSMTKAMVGIGESEDMANLYEAPVTEADLEEEIELEEACGDYDKDRMEEDMELEEAFSDLEEIMTMDSGDDQTGRSAAMAKKEAGKVYSKDGKASALKGYNVTEAELEEDTLEEEEQLQEKTKDTGPKSRGRDEPDRHHKPKMESRRIAAKKSASQINESKFDKKFHDLVKKWCK